MRTKVTRAQPFETLINANFRSASAKAVQTRSLIQEDDETWLMISRQEKTLTTSSTSKTRISPWGNGYFLQERLSFSALSLSQASVNVFLSFSPLPPKLPKTIVLCLFYFSWHFPLSFLTFSSTTACIVFQNVYDSLKLTTSVSLFHQISIFSL